MRKAVVSIIFNHHSVIIIEIMGIIAIVGNPLAELLRGASQLQDVVIGSGCKRGFQLMLQNAVLYRKRGNIGNLLNGIDSDIGCICPSGNTGQTKLYLCVPGLYSRNAASMP